MAMTVTENEWYTRGYNAAKEIYDNGDKMFVMEAEISRLRGLLKEAVEMSKETFCGCGRIPCKQDEIIERIHAEVGTVKENLTTEEVGGGGEWIKT